MLSAWKLSAAAIAFVMIWVIVGTAEAGVLANA
jgi:hypothetical protein